jgi:hypothetical protein
MKIIALIPAESVTAYQSIYTLTKNGQSPLFNLAVWIVLVATPLWQLYSTKAKGEPYAWDQAIISVPAFLVWLVALQSPFLNLPDDWTPVEHGLVLLMGTFLLPLVAWGINFAIGALTKTRGQQ